MVNKFFFTLQYWLKNPPWDTGITPPEVVAFLEENPPGKALDLGCGTGTNVLTMAEYGWEAVGVDFVPRAIRIARGKARRQGVSDQVTFQVGDVLSADIFRGFYNLILDIGCFHSFSGNEIGQYASNVAGHLSPGGSLLLYAHLTLDLGPGHGATETDLDILGRELTLVKRQDGEESARPSAWLQFRK